MSEKARGALFNALGDIKGLTLLDAYAGSGAVAIEAISRGVSVATAIDADVEAVKTIARNVRELGIEENVTVLRKNISGWSRNHQQLKYDIVVADPPYDDIRPDVLERLTAHVAEDGIYVLSWPGREKVREMSGFTVVTTKPLGDIQLVFYKPS